MDKIFFDRLRFYGYHGVFAHEALRGQHFEIDLELGCDLLCAAQSDNLGESSDYGEIYALVKQIVTTRRFALLEGLGGCICEEIFARFPKIEQIVLRLRKPEAPLEGGVLADEAAASGKAALPPWNGGQFAPGGSLGIELRRTRKAQNVHSKT